MTASDHWAEYMAAGFTYWPDVGQPVSILPTVDGSVLGDFPLTGAACFVTAHNPGGPAIDPADNDRRHAQLLRDVADHGWSWWAAVGGDPGGLHAEDGVLLLDASEDDAIDLGSRFDQEAIYVWRSSAVDLIACDRGSRDSLGWIATVGTTSLRRPRRAVG